MLDELLKEKGSIRKAAEAAGLTKSKFMVSWKKELNLCTGTTGCRSIPALGKTRCEEHLKYAFKKQDVNRRKQTQKQWAQDNADHKREYQKQYQRANKEKVNALNRKYSKTDKGKVVNRAKRAYRRALQKQATPSWVNKTELKLIYANCPQNHHVDHIIPLDNAQVCGLHVPWNLQYLTGQENDSKGNSFDLTYENKAWYNRVK